MPPLDEAGGGGGVAAEIVQTTLDHFGEPMIAGKTHSEILGMTNQQRYRWRKMILPEEKAEAMRIVETARRVKIRASLIGRAFTDEHKTKLSEVWTPERRAEISKNNPMNQPEVRAKRSGENHPAKMTEFRTRVSKWSKKRWGDPEIRRRTSESLKIAWSRPERRAATSGDNNPAKRPEVRAKISSSMKGKYVGPNAPNWQGGISFEPYCSKFNDQLKESIRNRDNRTCVLCGKSEIQNGRRLSVHHIDADKMQGCNHKNWYLCTLCVSCNSKPDTVEKEFLIVTGGRSVQ